MKLDEKALEAATAAVHFASDEDDAIELAETAIRTYLSAVPSSPVSELVERLRIAGRRTVSFCVSLEEEAATTLTSLSTRNAELEREVKRLRDALKPFSEAADELDERAQDHHDLWEHPVALNITVAHLREAHRALSTSPQGGEHE